MPRRDPELSIWRVGLVVLALYAMLAQSFVGALAGPAQPAFADAGVICLTPGAEGAPGEAPAPARHGPHDCVCPALCHGAVALIASAAAPGEPAGVDAPAAIPGLHAVHLVSIRSLPPARGPPHFGFARRI